MKAFLIRWVVTALAVLAAAHLVNGITYDSWGALALAALILGVLNAVIRPVLLFLSLPFIMVTLGGFILLINAVVLKLTGLISPGFRVEGFWATVFGAIIISVVSWAFSGLFKDENNRVRVLMNKSQLTGIKQARGRVVE